MVKLHTKYEGYVDKEIFYSSLNKPTTYTKHVIHWVEPFSWSRQLGKIPQGDTLYKTSRL